jgi:hypothetical protein
VLALLPALPTLRARRPNDAKAPHRAPRDGEEDHLFCSVRLRKTVGPLWTCILD